MTVPQRRVSAPLRPVIGADTRPAQLRLQLLGGFRAERVGVGWPVSGWQRRSAKTLTKLLATCRGHKLHREQLLEILWPGVELDSALNSFAKALYAARRALEPELLPRESSAYLVVTDSMVALRTEHVWIDADQFEQLAESALLEEDIGALEAALAAYGGELLPEDRYADWCAQRRDYLADLHLRLLTGLADALAKRGSHSAAAARLREVLELDPTSEDVHRRLMRLYLSAGPATRPFASSTCVRKCSGASWTSSRRPKRRRSTTTSSPTEPRREPRSRKRLSGGSRCWSTCANSSRTPTREPAEWSS
ncbi:MAG TPA: BTAD domain-containing putative transcriptional regulator [Gemmatimonadaceae bacterium]|nr:BTAD domain-containing putative transcriptional regulator [Gemmatimonadaceae bacterium]